MWLTSRPAACDSRYAAFSQISNTDFLRRYARRLLRDARGAEPSKALPVLRRIIAARIMPELRVTELYTVRASVQLKHVLHMLARDVGFSSWEICKRQVDDADAAVLDRFRLEIGMFGDFQQNWFADHAVALDWQRQHGGYLVNYGKQTVAILAH